MTNHIMTVKMCVWALTKPDTLKLLLTSPEMNEICDFSSLSISVYAALLHRPAWNGKASKKQRSTCWRWGDSRPRGRERESRSVQTGSPCVSNSKVGHLYIVGARLSLKFWKKNVFLKPKMSVRQMQYVTFPHLNAERKCHIFLSCVVWPLHSISCYYISMYICLSTLLNSSPVVQFFKKVLL